MKVEKIQNRSWFGYLCDRLQVMTPAWNLFWCCLWNPVVEMRDRNTVCEVHVQCCYDWVRCVKFFIKNIYLTVKMYGMWGTVSVLEGHHTKNSMHIIIGELYQAKAYLMISNFLILESWKVGGLRLVLESLTNFGLFFTFYGQNQLYLHINSLKSLFSS